MPKYMINIFNRDPESRKRAPYGADILEKHRQWSELLGKRELLSHKLADQTGHVLSYSANGIVDGPYVETKEAIGGFYLVEAKNYEEALEMARACPHLALEGGRVEVREVEL